MKKYRSNCTFQEIDQIEVERETESSVWISGRKHSKMTDFECFHDTFEEAKSYLISVCSEKVKRAAESLKGQEVRLVKAQNLLPKP